MKRTSFWLKRRLGIGNLRKMPKARRLDTCQQRINELGAGVTPRRSRVASHANPRVNEWTDQPWPDGSLMIDSVSRRRITFIARGITGLAGRERPQSDRCQEMPLDCIDNSPSAFAVYERHRESTDGENLIGPESVVSCARDVIHVDHVGEASELLIPEAFDKSRATSLENVAPARFQPRGCAEGVQPERLDFDRFSDARCDHTVAHPRVHPGELHARDASRQQAVRVHPDPESSAGGIAVYDLLDRGLEGSPLCCRQENRVVRDELQQLVDRDDVPEGRVDGVELGRLAMIGEPVWQHAF